MEKTGSDIWLALFYASMIAFIILVVAMILLTHFYKQGSKSLKESVDDIKDERKKMIKALVESFLRK